ncbi:propionyl-coenzyme A carboxylase alpha polypeptide [Mesorhizobium sp. M4B.F.Ca.ET.143.01.1.1]|nr:propionyl-coenzyme A carboxylase alpha polypeptide [Mesorhizobium sp. M4B.F.Ca.ET.017.02.2.1]TGV18401.1 propionyl-coenzyme A carboxylase alpha polypeptide [Mesorhizobium sp. M4B.F.Ca.ET.143.01.1.1]
MCRSRSVTPPSALPGISPAKGGRSDVAMLSPITYVARKAPPPALPISPLAGEMAGRPEGGA